MWNRWTTDRRTQQSRTTRCILCKEPGTEDSIEHYCKCRLTQRLLATRLNLCPRKFSNSYAWLLCSPDIASNEQLTSLAIVIYATYMVTNRLRHCTPLDQENTFQALGQAAKEGVKGHNKAMGVYNSRWIADSPTTPINYGSTTGNGMVQRLAKWLRNRPVRRVRQRCF